MRTAAKDEPSLSVTVNVQAHVQIDEVYAALNRDATAAKRAGDMALAVRLLRQAKARQGDMYQETRLAKFLQAAGLLEEALAELQWLRERAATWAKAMFGHQPVSVVLAHKLGWQAAIEYDAALICKRSGRPDLEAGFRDRFETYAALRDKMRDVADLDSAARQEERRRRLQERLATRSSSPPARAGQR